MTPRSTLPAALGRPEGLPGAAKARMCKRLQREHQLRPPSQSTWDPLSHAAPPALNLPLTLPAHTVLAYPLPQGLPPRRTLGVGGLTGLRPLPPTPKEDLAVSNMRMARSDFSYEYLDEEFNPRRMMLKPR